MHIGSDSGVRSELNVTPMIDVVLVLLIIFMVVTPLLERKLPVVVPEAVPSTEEAPQSSLVIEVDAQGGLAWAGAPAAGIDALHATIAEALRGRASRDRVVFVGAHEDAPYARVIDAMDAARRAGATHVGIIDTPARTPEP